MMIYSTGVAFINENIEKACTLAPFTHVYSFDIGFPPKTLAQLARQFNDSHSTKYLVSFHTPHTIIDKYTTIALKVIVNELIHSFR